MDKVDRFKILQPETCHYRVITEEGEWYCDIKKIPPEVCIHRQQRYLYMRQAKGNPKIVCYPIGMKKANLRKKKSKRRWCKRDMMWFNMGEKNCMECTWLPTECPVKKEALREGM